MTISATSSAVDDAGAVVRAYGAEPVWDGLGLLDETFVPHYRSPGHPEAAAIELVLARYQADGVAYRALRDGQVLLINGPKPRSCDNGDHTVRPST